MQILKPRSAILLFIQDKTTFLSCMGTVLKFNEGPFSDLLFKILKTLKENPSNIADLEKKLSDWDSEDIHAVVDVLHKYKLFQEDQNGTHFERVAPEETQRPSAAFLVPKEFEETWISAASLSAARVDLRTIAFSNMSEESLLGALAELKEEQVPVLTLPYYDCAFFRSANQIFIQRKKPWILAFGHDKFLYFLSISPGKTSCFECLFPLKVSGIALSNVLFYSDEFASPLESQLRTTVLAIQIETALSDADSPHFLLKFDIESLNLNRVRWCPSGKIPGFEKTQLLKAWHQPFQRSAHAFRDPKDCGRSEVIAWREGSISSSKKSAFKNCCHDSDSETFCS